MKTTIVSLALATLSLAAAGDAFAGQPNLYVCRNAAAGIELGYSTTSFVGTPDFNLSVRGRDVLHGQDSENLVDISATDSPLGEVVSAVVTRTYIADAPSLVYTVIIPGIEMGDANTVKFNTVLLEGSNGGFMALPAVYQRINKTTKLQCEARKVFF